MENKTRNVIWTITGILLMTVLVIATSTITDSSIDVGGNATIDDVLTFRQAETIDNLENGYLRVTGGLNVTDNLVVSNNVTLNNLRIQANASGVSCAGAYEGDVYYDGTTKLHYGCNSTDWVALY